MTSCSLTSYAMMSAASFSAAASAAIPVSSTALAVAVTCCARPPQVFLPASPEPACGADHAAAAPLGCRCPFRVTRRDTSRSFPVGESALRGQADPWVGGQGSDVAVLVQPTLGDVLDDAVRHQVPDRLLLADAMPAPGRGDRQRRDL